MVKGEGVYFDYVEDDLLKLKDCETTVKFYVAENYKIKNGRELGGSLFR